MNQGQYDKDCTTWSPEGNITQIKHAMEAVDQGTPLVGLVSDKYAVVAAFRKRQNEKFSSFDKKLFKIDTHCGIGIAGMTADARVLADYMRNECLNHKYVFDGPMQIGRLVAQIGDKSQKKTLVAGKRPYGVGLLIAAYDETGPHIYQTVPSGDYFEYKAYAMGKTCNSAKTYLEKHFESFPPLDVKALIRHAVKALAVTSSAQNTELSVGCIDVAVVGVDTDFKIISDAELKPYIDEVKADEPAPMQTE